MDKKIKHARQDTPKFRMLNSKRAKYQVLIADPTANFIYSSHEKFEDICRDELARYETESQKSLKKLFYNIAIT